MKVEIMQFPVEAGAGSQFDVYNTDEIQREINDFIKDKKVINILCNTYINETFGYKPFNQYVKNIVSNKVNTVFVYYTIMYED